MFINIVYKFITPFLKETKAPIKYKALLHVSKCICRIENIL